MVIVTNAHYMNNNIKENENDIFNANKPINQMEIKTRKILIIIKIGMRSLIKLFFIFLITINCKCYVLTPGLVDNFRRTIFIKKQNLNLSET